MGAGVASWARERRRPPAGLLALGLVAAAAAALPAAYLLILVADDVSGAISTIATSRTARLLAETIAHLRRAK